METDGTRITYPSQYCEATLIAATKSQETEDALFEVASAERLSTGEASHATLLAYNDACALYDATIELYQAALKASGDEFWKPDSIMVELVGLYERMEVSDGDDDLMSVIAHLQGKWQYVIIKNELDWADCLEAFRSALVQSAIRADHIDRICRLADRAMIRIRDESAQGYA